MNEVTKAISRLPVVSRVAATAVLALSALACSTPTPPEVGGGALERWQCRNDVEIRCVEGACEATADDGFTAMSVSADSAGGLEVCAYSGCWQGTAAVTRSEPAFVVLVGRDLPFSSAPEPGEGSEDVVFAIDLRDHVALLKVGEFAHPLICESE